MSTTLHLYEKKQPEPDAPVALLIHGLGANSKHWSRVARDLYKEGFTVYCPDLPGHGLSPRNELYTAKDWVDALLGLNITPDLIVGHSMGGLLAAYLQPLLKAKTLILIDPVFSIPGPKKLLPVVRFSFAQSVKNSYWLDHTKTFKQKVKSARTRFDETIWDVKTVQALTPDPKTIVNQLRDKTNTVIIFRPHGSLILPYRTIRHIKKLAADNIHYYKLRRGHNSHILHYENFWNILKEHLKGTQYVHNQTNTIPSTSTL